MTAGLISVVLATYNGERHLPEQLASIYRQTYREIEVVASDDGSSDDTVKILDSFRRSHGLRYLQSDRRAGVVGNFQRALGLARGRYIAFCDQDDVWLLTKLEDCVMRMHSAESVAGSSTPVLVHTDLRLVDENRALLSESFYRQVGRHPEALRLSWLLRQNVVTGCTCLVNRPLLGRGIPIPGSAVMHDWWLALVAMVFGRIEYLAVPTVEYRQHSTNALGAPRSDWIAKAKKAITLGWDNDGYREGLELANVQAQEFLTRYAADLSPDVREVVERFASLPSKSWVRRRIATIHGRYLKGRVTENAEMLARM
jgi:glycosyltransferase involved in cell wall biosynthesis